MKVYRNGCWWVLCHTYASQKRAQEVAQRTEALNGYKVRLEVRRRFLFWWAVWGDFDAWEKHYSSKLLTGDARVS